LIGVAVVIWTSASSYRIWTTPLQYEVVEGHSGADGQSGQRRGVAEVSFSEVSALGAVPLVIPVALAVSGMMAILGRRGAATVRSALLLLGFSIISGFSIGNAYVFPGLALLGAGALSTLASRDSSPAKDITA
jgi:hypothetical protein